MISNPPAPSRWNETLEITRGYETLRESIERGAMREHPTAVRLRAHKYIVSREGGNSMSPRIKHREPVVLKPVTEDMPLKKNDMVFCYVGGNWYTHLIKSIQGNGEKRRFQISNLKGRVNGTIGLDKIFGKVIVVGENACKKFMDNHKSWF